MGKEDARVLLIGRLGKILQLNGSSVGGRERLDYEIYYLSLCAVNPLELSQSLSCHPRYAELVESFSAS